MIKETGYRLNVGLIILNDKGKLLLCKRKDVNSWQFPQGGIDFNENPSNAAKRELFEEVGIKSTSVKLIKEMGEWVKYDIPKKSRRRNFLKKKIKGQKQKWFMYKLRENTSISFENDPDKEFDDYKWVSYWYPLYCIVSFKKEVYRKVLNSLSSSFCKEFNHD
jgi:putative (di)nucleoside polyphosphate hydrolase